MVIVNFLIVLIWFKSTLVNQFFKPAFNILKNSVNVDLIYEGMKYCIRATQTGKSNYMMELGHSKKDVEVSNITLRFL